MAKIELVGVCKTLREGMAIQLPLPFPVEQGTKMAVKGKSFNLQDINLVVPDSKVMVILGPSGCGKTTILRIIAGFIQPDAGQVLYDGVDIRLTPTGKRQIGMVFQSYALYPHFSTKKNILSYFFFHKKTPELSALAREKYQRTSQLMGVELEYLLDREPSGLSGGEKQRVALARCITREPRLFLLDEPFANLDQRLREKYRASLKTLLREFNITTVYVTHDQQEALILADQLAIMDAGQIVQVGTYTEIYAKPASLFVAEFLNPNIYSIALNILDGERIADAYHGLLVGVRPEDIHINDQPQADGMQAIVHEVTEAPVLGQTLVHAVSDSLQFQVRLAGHINLTEGQTIWLSFDRMHVFNKHTGLRIRTITP
jgi:ABC-type sugar transport system ATPase subunit